MNLFVGVLFSNYTEAINKEEKKGIQDNKLATRYLDYLKQLDTVSPDYYQFRKKTSKVQLFFSKITNFKFFDNFIMIISMKLYQCYFQKNTLSKTIRNFLVNLLVK